MICYIEHRKASGVSTHSNILQRSIVTRLRCGGIFIDHFITAGQRLENQSAFGIDANMNIMNLFNSQYPQQSQFHSEL